MEICKHMWVSVFFWTQCKSLVGWHSTAPHHCETSQDPICSCYCEITMCPHYRLRFIVKFFKKNFRSRMSALNLCRTRTLSPRWSLITVLIQNIMQQGALLRIKHGPREKMFEVVSFRESAETIAAVGCFLLFFFVWNRVIVCLHILLTDWRHYLGYSSVSLCVVYLCLQERL